MLVAGLFQPAGFRSLDKPRPLLCQLVCWRDLMTRFLIGSLVSAASF